MIHERDLREHPGIKRSYLNLPDTLEGKECYCVTIPAGLSNKLVLIDLLGMATQWFNWARTNGIEAKQSADAWRDALGLPELKMCCCPSATNQRYTADGILQVSYDGGQTWQDARELDPRFNAPLSPPLDTPAGQELRCEAASNVVAAMRAAADELIADTSAWAGITGVVAVILAIIALFGIIGSAGALTPLLVGLGAALFTAGSAAFDAAMTEGVYDQLLCIVFCNTPIDGIYTEESWQAIKAGIDGDITGIAGQFLFDTINALGPAGLNNQSRAGMSATADCSTCACDVCQFVLTFDGLNWTDYTIDYGSQVGGVLNCRPHTYPSGAGTGLKILIDMIQDCEVGLVRFDYTFVNQRTIHDVGLVVTLYNSSMVLVGQEGGNNPEIANGVPSFAQFNFAGATGRFVELEVSWLNEGTPNTGEIDNLTINIA